MLSTVSLPHKTQTVNFAVALVAAYCVNERVFCVFRTKDACFALFFNNAPQKSVYAIRSNHQATEIWNKANDKANKTCNGCFQSAREYRFQVGLFDLNVLHLFQLIPVWKFGSVSYGHWNRFFLKVFLCPTLYKLAAFVECAIFSR